MVERVNEGGSYSRRAETLPEPRDERFIRQKALRERQITRARLNSGLRTAYQHTLPPQTIRRLLNEAGLSNIVPTKKQLLSRDHRFCNITFY